MEPLHARYPFLRAAREAVEDAGVDLGRVVAEGGPAVERGRERVRRGLVEGTTAPEARWDDRAELLSYPVARVLVSLLDVPGVVDKYARAEAALAYERFTDDFDNDAELKSTTVPRLSLSQFLADFELDAAVAPTGDGRFEVAVTRYLELAGDLDGDRWRLVARPLADGRVPVVRRDLYTLLRVAVRRRVATDLPLSVPEPIEAALADEVADLEAALADVDLPRDIDTVAPEQFPPCMDRLVKRARSEEVLAPHSRFALLTFLGSIGMDAEAVLAFCEYDGPAAEAVRRQAERLLEGEGAAYAPPSCASLQAYGDCVDPDERCETIPNPLSYYGEALADAAPAEGESD